MIDCRRSVADLVSNDVAFLYFLFIWLLFFLPVTVLFEIVKNLWSLIHLIVWTLGVNTAQSNEQNKKKSALVMVFVPIFLHLATQNEQLQWKLHCESFYVCCIRACVRAFAYVFVNQFSVILFYPSKMPSFSFYNFSSSFSLCPFFFISVFLFCFVLFLYLFKLFIV